LKNPELGAIIPNMGVIKDSGEAGYAVSGCGIADALFNRVQQRVLGILFGNPDRSFYSNELVSMAESGTGAVFRELRRLAEAGIVTVEKIGRQKHYQANPECPVFDELRGLVLKTVGLGDMLRAALAPLSKTISLAFVYGSVAKGSDTADSDVDLLVVSDDLSYAQLYEALEDAIRQLGKVVNPTVYTRAEFSQRQRDENAFIARVLKQPKIWILGNPNELQA
jgi:predicted nucleotidyltransferase